MCRCGCIHSCKIERRPEVNIRCLSQSCLHLISFNFITFIWVCAHAHASWCMYHQRTTGRLGSLQPHESCRVTSGCQAGEHWLSHWVNSPTLPFKNVWGRVCQWIQSSLLLAGWQLLAPPSVSTLQWWVTGTHCHTWAFSSECLGSKLGPYACTAFT